MIELMRKNRDIAANELKKAQELLDLAVKLAMEQVLSPGVISVENVHALADTVDVSNKEAEAYMNKNHIRMRGNRWKVSPQVASVQNAKERESTS